MGKRYYPPTTTRRLQPGEATKTIIDILDPMPHDDRRLVIEALDSLYPGLPSIAKIADLLIGSEVDK